MRCFELLYVHVHLLGSSLVGEPYTCIKLEMKVFEIYKCMYTLYTVHVLWHINMYIVHAYHSGMVMVCSVMVAMMKNYFYRTYMYTYSCICWSPHIHIYTITGSPGSIRRQVSVPRGVGSNTNLHSSDQGSPDFMWLYACVMMSLMPSICAVCVADMYMYMYRYIHEGQMLFLVHELQSLNLGLPVHARPHS